MTIESCVTLPREWARRCTWLCVAAGLAVLAPAAQGQTGPAPTEYEVKAAFLYNFAKFVSWPPAAFPDAEAPFQLGILGDDPFGEALARLVASQRVQGRPFVIVHGRSPAELARCHILFISDSEQSRLAQHLAALRQAHSYALTVSDLDDFRAAGGMIHFVLERSRVRFQINPDSATAAGLTISSKLLSLARNAYERS